MAKTTRVSDAQSVVTVEMTFTRETKGTFVFGNAEDAAPIPTLYIRKGAFPNGAPSKITVNVVAVPT